MNKSKFIFSALGVAFFLSCSDTGNAGVQNGNDNSIGTCGGKKYDSALYDCVRGEIVGSCRGQDYYPEYERCENGEIKSNVGISSSSLLASSSSFAASSSSSFSLSSNSSRLQSSSSVASSSSYVSSSSSSAGSTVSEFCTGYCLWDTGCWQIETDPIGQYGDPVYTCETAIYNCQTYSKVFTDPNCGGTAATSSNSSGTSSSSSSIIYGSLTYQGQTYKTVKIGEQTWMAENLNYNVSGSVCYNNNSSNCTTYGRLYDWVTAMDISSVYSRNSYSYYDYSTKHQGICPSGWHIPSNAEWTTLINYVSFAVGDQLKATHGWNNGVHGNSGNGTDNYGFSALPSGRYSAYTGSYYNVGEIGHWWSSDNNADLALKRTISINDYYVVREEDESKMTKISVRCVQD